MITSPHLVAACASDAGWQKNARHQPRLISTGATSPCWLGNILSIALIWLATNLGFSQPTPAPSKIRVGVLVDNYPFSFREADGQMQGFAYELTQEIEQVMGLQFDRIEGTTKTINGAFEAGQIDLLQSLARTPERERTIEFSVPYLAMTGQVFARKGGPPIKALADLKGRKVLVHQGSLGESLLLKAGLQDSIVYAESVEQAFVQLERGAADATLATRLTGLSLVHRLGLNQVQVLDVVIPQFEVNYCFAAQKGDHVTLARINEGMAILVRTGKFDALYKKWFGFVTPTGYTTEQVLLAVAVGLSLALAVTIWAVLRQRTLLARIAEQAAILQRREASLATAQAQAHLGSWELGPATQRGTWSAEMGRLFYYDLTRGTPAFEEFLELVHPEDRARLKAVHADLSATSMLLQHEYRTNPALGPMRHLSATRHVLRDAMGRAITIVGTTLDITERKQAEAALQTSSRQLRALSAHLETSREAERVRISREIHDVLGQKLTALKMDLYSLEKKLPQVGDPALRAGLEEKIVMATALADEIVVTVQRIAAELRPATLDNLGLVSTLQYEAKQFEARTSIPVVLNLPTGPVKLNNQIATTAYRIFQEVLTNIIRHAQATEVRLSLDVSPTLLRLRVADNGVGVSPENLAHPQSLGLLGMTERAAMVNGHIRIQGAPGQGTMVQLEIPIENCASTGQQSTPP
ncbi:MAG: transporter substrate-binding domain-containing protein [Verrucomicrobiota bacterium]